MGLAEHHSRQCCKEPWGNFVFHLGRIFAKRTVWIYRTCWSNQKYIIKHSQNSDLDSVEKRHHIRALSPLFLPFLIYWLSTIYLYKHLFAVTWTKICRLIIWDFVVINHLILCLFVVIEFSWLISVIEFLRLTYWNRLIDLSNLLIFRIRIRLCDLLTDNWITSWGVVVWWAICSWYKTSVLIFMRSWRWT